MAESLSARLLRGGGWALGMKIASGASTFAVNMLLARLLSPDDLGMFFLAFSLATILSQIVQWGLTRAVVREVAAALAKNDHKLAVENVRGVAAIVLMVGIAVVVIMVSPLGEGVLSLVSDEVGTSENIAGLVGDWALLMALQLVVSESFRGMHDLRRASIHAGALTAMIALVFFGAEWMAGMKLEARQAILTAQVALAVAVMAGGWTLIRTCKGMVKDGGYGFNHARRLLSLGLPFLVTNLVLFAALELHIWVLGYFHPESEVAEYGAAYRLVMLLALPLGIANSILPSHIADLYARGKKSRMERMLRIMATVTGAGGLLMVTVLVLLGHWILGVAYGDAYVDAYDVMLVLAVGQLVNVLTGSPGLVLTMSGRVVYVLRSAALANLFGIAVSIVSVPTYGAVGAAVGYAVAISISNLLMMIVCRASVGVRTHGSFSALVDIYCVIVRRLRSAAVT